MILLDTNVISEPMRPSPDENVLHWLDAQPLETLYLSSLTVGELRAGVTRLPVGKRRASLHEHLETRVLPQFVGRVLPFDLACASAYANLLEETRQAGYSIQTADACIAAIASAHRLIVATRTRNPFSAAGLRVIDPWAA